MDHYIDIRLRPDPEFAEHDLMSTLFGKLHRRLVQQGEQNVGISFPNVKAEKPTLGNQLRLHGTAQALLQLMSDNWLSGMHDHIQLYDLSPVPARVSYRVVCRVHAQNSPERLRRRQMRRHGYSEEEARARIPDNSLQQLRHPFIVAGSQSTRQKFYLFIQHGELTDTPQQGEFNAYGLSRTATVPWF